MSRKVYRGTEAFWAIWQAFPSSTVYGFMGVMVTAPVMNQIARIMYKGFASKGSPFLTDSVAFNFQG